MKITTPREDIVNLLRNLRPDIQEDTLEIHRMGYPTDPLIPWSVFTFCTLEGIQLTIEVSNRGFTVSDVALPGKISNLILYHYLVVVKEMSGKSYPTVQAVLMLASPFYHTRHSTKSGQACPEFAHTTSKPRSQLVR
ncbi:hypothetical protein K7432_007205 [Basidiobolus ranarum]|uniref:Uncharacterized protein n=1 Tax=Basidiobolus ranarum TaxID=34480 RepID=A0ABR2WTT5_9FUNG